MKYFLSLLLLLPIGLHGAGFDPIAKFPGVRSDGPLGMGITTNITLALGTNNITTYRQGYVRLNSPAGDPLTVTIELSTGSFTGCMLMLQNAFTGSAFTLFNNSPLWDDPTGEVYLRNGSWVSTDINDTLLLVMTPRGWAEVARIPGNVSVITGDALWAMTNGVMYTAPEFVTNKWEFREGGVAQLTVSTNGSLAVGTNTMADFGGDLGGLALAQVLHVDLGEPDNAGVVLQSLNNTNNTIGGIGLNARTTGSVISSYWQTNGLLRQLSISMGPDVQFFSMVGTDSITRVYFDPHSTNATYQHFLDTDHAVTSNPLFALLNFGTNQLSFGPDPRITWGVDATNYLFWTPNDLVLSFGAAGIGTNQIGVNLGGNTFIGNADASKAVYFGNTILAADIFPHTANTYSVGRINNSAGTYKDVVSQTNHVVGADDGVGNYSWLATYSTGGVAVLDFENAGTGTPFSKLSVRSNGVPVQEFPPLVITYAHAGTVTLTNTPWLTKAYLAPTGNVTFATSDLQAGHDYIVFGRNLQASNITLSFPQNGGTNAWQFMGGAPTPILPGATFTLGITSMGTVDTNVWASCTIVQ